MRPNRPCNRETDFKCRITGDEEAEETLVFSFNHKDRRRQKEVLDFIEQLAKFGAAISSSLLF